MIGLALGIYAPVRYLSLGYDFVVLLCWLASILLLFVALGRSDGATDLPNFWLDRRDRYLLLTLLAMFAPLYLAGTYHIPVQVSTDEIVISLEASWRSSLAEWDVFALSGYFQFPAMEFIIYGLLGRFAGGIDLASMRFIHSAAGLSIVGLAFLFLRPLCTRGQAFVGAILLGSNHALLAISRMAMRNDSALLIELAAMALLLRGLKAGKSSCSYLGGALAGLAFYFYEPGRFTMFIWIAAVGLLAVYDRGRRSRPTHRRQLTASLVAFAAVIAPLVAASVQAVGQPDAFSYQREQLLFTPEGMELQRSWVQASSLAEAVRINIVQGLSTFNSPLHDQGYVYFNPGHGFVDPLTGVLLWLGLAGGLRQLRGRDDAMLLAPGVLIPWLVYSFLTTKAPNYTRLLITLPFVAYFTLRGILFVSSTVARTLELRGLQMRNLRLSRVLAGALVTLIVGWNLWSYADYALRGLREGEEVGSTGRYVAARAESTEHEFYIATNIDYPFNPYWDDVEAERWVEWIEFFAVEEQGLRAVPPGIVSRIVPKPPFTIFMNSDLWDISAERLTDRFPSRRVHRMLADGSLLAIEVLGGEADG